MKWQLNSNSQAIQKSNDTSTRGAEPLWWKELAGILKFAVSHWKRKPYE